ncbi:MAG: hypothetical protein KDJ65_04590 [Anaerolineae bacterium]|nr:hypothetical protein [Anaerolineae bacterium]
MTQPKVIVVHLRRPRSNDENEMRSDPFWEFGSFGCTRCHQRNLMNPNKLHLLAEARMAFAQGGDKGFRLVHLTSPVNVTHHGTFGEVKWQPANMPFKYDKAPLLIDNLGHTDFALLKKFIEATNRPSWESKFSSRFRTRRNPLDKDIAQEIVDVFEQKFKTASPDSFAVTYADALPYPPPKIDLSREQTYLRYLE